MTCQEDRKELGRILDKLDSLMTSYPYDEGVDENLRDARDGLDEAIYAWDEMDLCKRKK